MLCERDRSGYFDRMARAGQTEPDSVSIWLKLSGEDAARMTQVLARPEFAAPELVPDEPEARVDDEAPADEPEPVADELERPAQAECPHPADARDYQSGTCAACGAILWD